jgi:hypothetical protein
MDLALWAQLNLIGHVSYADYLDMTPDEAHACYKALERAIHHKTEVQKEPDRFAAFDELCRSKVGGF